MSSQQLRCTFFLLADKMLKTVAPGIHKSLITLETVPYNIIHFAPEAGNGDNDVFATLAAALLGQFDLSRDKRELFHNAGFRLSYFARVTIGSFLTPQDGCACILVTDYVRLAKSANSEILTLT